MKFIGTTEEYLHLETLSAENCQVLKEVIESSLTILWFETGKSSLIIDGRERKFSKNEILYVTEFHKVEVVFLDAVRFVRFNRPFYCILDHDAEVGCSGALFFGASQLPVIKIPKIELEKFETLWKMFVIEMQSNDSLQIDMLQMMLKRYLILGTRVYKLQEKYPENNEHDNLVREFNFLVEKHFKTKQTVAEYAEMLHKSPKTISNIFSKLGTKTPLQYIQERKILEARRLLRYSNLQIKEISYQIGFGDLQAFSRFFKKYEGISPSEFKEKRF
jgi:AraC-like DNA-binding protein